MLCRIWSERICFVSLPLPPLLPVPLPFIALFAIFAILRDSLGCFRWFIASFFSVGFPDILLKLFDGFRDSCLRLLLIVSVISKGNTFRDSLKMLRMFDGAPDRLENALRILNILLGIWAVSGIDLYFLNLKKKTKRFLRCFKIFWQLIGFYGILLLLLLPLPLLRFTRTFRGLNSLKILGDSSRILEPSENAPENIIRSQSLNKIWFVCADYSSFDWKLAFLEIL